MTGTRSITPVKVAVSLRVRVATDLIRDRLGDLAVSAGPAVATQIHTLVMQERLGYCPALQFFSDRPEIGPGLVAAVEEVGAFVCDYVTREVRNRLWTAFSHLHVQHTQLIALTLPSIRPAQPGALAALTRHYTPTEVNLGLVLSSIQKGPAVEGLERLTAQKVLWWLHDAFETVEVRSAHLVQN